MLACRVLLGVVCGAGLCFECFLIVVCSAGLDLGSDADAYIDTVDKAHTLIIGALCASSKGHLITPLF